MYIHDIKSIIGPSVHCCITRQEVKNNLVEFALKVGGLNRHTRVRRTICHSDDMDSSDALAVMPTGKVHIPTKNRNMWR